MKHTKYLLLAALLAVFGLIAAACGSDDDSSSSASDPIRVAVVAPSASTDLAFTQSMVEAIEALGNRVTVDISDGLFIVEDAAVAIRQYAQDGFDLVIAHGSQYGGSLQEIAPNFPDVSFAWGPVTDTFGLDNVFAYTVAAEEGGYVLGSIAAQITESNNIGVVGPIEVGDARRFIGGFVAGAEATSADVNVNVVYIESFSDVAKAAETAEAHIAQGADVLTGSAQMVVGAVGVAVEENIPWFGTQSDQTVLAPDLLVASQLYEWEVILEQILDNIDAGVKGGQSYTIDLANGGLNIAYNDGYDLPQEVRDAAQATIDSIIDGSIDPQI